MALEQKLSPEEEQAAQEILEDLRKISDPEKQEISCFCGHHSYTIKEMISDIENKTPEGLENIRLYMKAQETVRNYKNS